MKKTSIEEMKNLFRALGVATGDTVLVFSNAGSLGLVERNMEGITEALCRVLGEDGTIVVPTFSFSFCRGEEFDPKNTKSTCGALTNHVRSVAGAVRSVHANHSFAAIGPRSSEALVMRDKSSFGPGSAFASMLMLNVMVLLLGTDHNTYVHYVEQQAGVGYRYDKTFRGVVRTNDERYEDAFSYFVRKPGIDGTSHADRASQRAHFFSTGACRSVPWGYGMHRSFRAAHLCEFLADRLNEDPLYLVDKNKYFASLARLKESTYEPTR